MEEFQVTRKDFLKLAGAGAALAGTSVLVSGCSGLSTASPRPKMNVVVVIIDSLRKDHVGAYGNDWILTPNLDALAAESLRFTRAYPEALPTIPTRRAIHTGLRTFPFADYTPEEHREALFYGWLPIPTEQTTLATILGDNGFETVLVTDTYHQFKPSMNFHRGFKLFHFIRGQETDRYLPYWTVPEERMRRYLPIQEVRTRHHLANTAGREREEDWFAPQVFLKASELLRACADRQPFLMVVDAFDPHEPWDAPDEYANLYDGSYEGPEPFCPQYGNAGYLTERQIQRMRALYAGEVTLVDRWLGRFLEAMRESRLMRNTLLVVLSDHGHLLGEHGVTGKPLYGLWPELLDIPFLIRHPEGRRAGETSDHYASTHDVAPTVLGALGIDPPEPMDGQDLSVLFYGEQPEPRPYFTSGFSNHSWARDERYALIFRNDGRDSRLYDLREDPGQERNIAEDEEDRVEQMVEEYLLPDAGGRLSSY